MKNLIIKKVILVAEPGPEPVWRGTMLTIAPTADSPTYGIYYGELAAGHGSVTVDWGDGAVETFAGISLVKHTYAEPGEYVVKISDDIAKIGCSGPVGPHEFTRLYAKLLKKVVVTAENLTTLNSGAFRQSDGLVKADFSESSIAELPATAFYGCAALTGSVSFPDVIAVDGTAGTVPFYGCTALEAIHFALSAKPTVTTSAGYKADAKLGAQNATVFFDL